MSLQFVDSFDHYASADLFKKWTSFAFVTAPTIVTSGGRRNGGYLNVASAASVAATGQNGVQKTLAGNYGTIICGVAIQINSGFGPNPILRFWDTNTIQCSIWRTTANTLQAFRGNNTALLGTSTGGAALLANGWVYVEVKVTFSATVGTVDIHVNGHSVLSLTNQNTIATANAFANFLGLYGGNTNDTSSVVMKYDDLYVCDGGGAANNDFLGDTRVDALFPISDGAYTAWTPSTGVSHFAMVDENPPNTTDYNAASVVGDTDSYGFQSMTGVTPTVYGVQLNLMILKDDAGPRSVEGLARSGGVDGFGASQGVSTAQTDVMQIYETDPSTGVAWTAGGVNGAEFGARVA